MSYKFEFLNFDKINLFSHYTFKSKYKSQFALTARDRRSLAPVLRIEDYS